jgi:integrase/recombinase XerD
MEESNPSSKTISNYKWTLNNFIQFHNNRSLYKMTREDIISYLNRLKKTDANDPLHKWIGSYDQERILLRKFFKWFYSIFHNNPKVLNHIISIPKLKRKEISIYKPSDLWSTEDDLLFLKYCPDDRVRCYHSISRDLSARPHEILDLKIRDIVFKTARNKFYAECLVNGKTGSRHLPLIDSLPYVKNWIDQHPRRNNPDAYLICSKDRKHFALKMTVPALRNIYNRYKSNFFPKILRDPDISTEDKQKIIELLKKPWNLYIRRHSALTEKSKYLKEPTLRQHAGWSGRSQMPWIYEHYFGNESNNSILQEYGILPKDNEEIDVLRPKQCPNCNEPNKPDSRFCAKCRMILTYDAYSETIEEKQIKDKQIEEMMRKQEQFEQLIQSLIDSGQLKPKTDVSNHSR